VTLLRSHSVNQARFLAGFFLSVNFVNLVNLVIT